MIRVGLLGILLLSGTPVGVEAKAPTLTTQEEEKFYKELRTEIEKSVKEFNRQKEQIASGRYKATEKDKESLANIATASEVKLTLFKNFYNTPSIQSQKVRSLLLKLFKKNFITMDDLTELKKLVASEKKRMQQDGEQQL